MAGARTARIRYSTTLFVAERPIRVETARAQVEVRSVVVLVAPFLSVSMKPVAPPPAASLQFRKHAVEGRTCPARDGIREPRRPAVHTWLGLVRVGNRVGVGERRR